MQELVFLKKNTLIWNGRIRIKKIMEKSEVHANKDQTTSFQILQKFPTLH